ncbi:hypothetical protein QCA50_012215 [Cerrena zonata]|uniref:Cell wall mannoprotein PIR1-like C-terminal domain-containing protein n=1 Tax=Cerrena zonata TaxID=2478898 RepID=A0AAW0FZU5_9APHY
MSFTKFLMDKFRERPLSPMNDDEEDSLDEEAQEEIKAKREVEEDSCDEDDDENESFVSPVYAVSCKTNTTLEMSLEGGILKDSNNRIGCIVGSRQFQFDGPLPQHGAIYAAGWSITNKAQLALVLFGRIL